MDLTSQNVRRVVRRCLATSAIRAFPIMGIVGVYRFDLEKVEKNRTDIQSMIDEVPDEFLRHRGGGMSFLKLCQDRNDTQWAGTHSSMEALVMLGIAIDRAAFCAPRETWSVMPGGMPYVMFLHSSDTKPLTQTPTPAETS